MNKDTILGVVRHALTFAGGFAVAKGLIDQSALPEIIGAVVTVIGAVWSVVEKINRPKI